MTQFDALLAILEPHMKKKTTTFCELSVQGSLWCFVLRDEVDELDNRHSGFWRSLVRWLWTVKTPLKMLATDAKNAKDRTRSDFFYDGRKFWRQCVNVIDVTWGRIYFSTCENFGRKFWTQCAMAFIGINVDWLKNSVGGNALQVMQVT